MRRVLAVCALTQVEFEHRAAPALNLREYANRNIPIRMRRVIGTERAETRDGKPVVVFDVEYFVETP